MKIINHQLLDKSFFIPKWDCKTLVLGTFNPDGGDCINYFYGRKSNYFWKAISAIDNKNELFYYTLITNNRNDYFELMKNRKFGCTDVIKMIECPNEVIGNVNGRGYNDQVLFNGQIIRHYNFDDIKNYIVTHSQKTVKVTKIINTVGNRFDLPTPLEFSDHLSDFIKFCKINNIEFISSPSASAYAVKTHRTDFEKLKEFYRLHLFTA